MGQPTIEHREEVERYSSDGLCLRRDEGDIPKSSEEQEMGMVGFRMQDMVVDSDVGRG